MSVVIAVFAPFNFANAVTPKIVIAYAQAELSQQQAYGQAIKGIENVLGQTQQLDISTESDVWLAQLEHLHPDRIIALGKHATDAITSTAYGKQMLAGLDYFNASKHKGVGLSLSTQTLSKQLARFVPAIKRVFVVQEESHQSISASTEPGTAPRFIFREGVNMIATIRLLGHLVEEEATTTDAVFIPANLPNDILYEIMGIAWERKLILLSTNPDQLENGILIAFFPDAFGQGEQLARMATQDALSYESAQTINSALNRKLAQHLTIDFDADTLKLFTVKIK